MWAFLEVIPKKWWLYIALVFSGAIVVGTAFTKGSEYGKQKCLVASQKALDEALDQALTKAQADLEKALAKQREGLKVIEDLTTKYTSVERDKQELQKALDDAINNPPTTCNNLDPRYYELYRKMYNREPPTR